MILRLAVGTLQIKLLAALSLLTTIVVLLSPRVGMLIVPILLMGLSLPTLRATPFEAALPVRAPHIFRLKAGATLILVTVPFLVWIVDGLIRPQPAAFLDGTTPLRVELLLIAMISAIAPSVARPELTLSPSAARTEILTTPVVVISGVLIIYLLPDWGSLSVLALGVMIAWVRVWRGIPESFQIAPIAVGAAGLKRPLSSRSEGRGAAGRWWMPLWRTLASPQFLILMLMVASATYGGIWVAYVGLLGFSEVIQIRMRSGWMYALPFSQRKLTLLNVLPMVSFPILGLAAGTLLMSRLIGPEPIRHQAVRSDSRQHFRNGTEVPLTFWELAPEGLKTITSPWGEVSPADTAVVLGMTFFNPYSAHDSTTDAFFEWQFARVTTAVYGRPLSPEQYNDEKNRPARITAALEVMILAAGAIVTSMLLLMLLFEFPRWHVLSRHPRLRVTATTIIFCIVTAAMAVELYYQFTLRTPLVVPLAQKGLLRISSYLPAGILPAVVAAAMPVVGAFLLLAAQFSRSDLFDRGATRAAWLLTGKRMRER